ncbi:something about silencing protein 10 [Anopheles bellator]|uniref:something about silencing protein 10 n=1 Tax=Anopheles bellator TaxID=139047 RepID=UPI002649081E|nr:something about silencing protein 10 [Anopheles bellator]
MSEKIKISDVGSDYEPSDSENEYSDGEKQLLKLNVNRRDQQEDDGSEAVLQFEDDDGTDGEDYEDDDGEPDFEDIRKFEHDSDLDEANEEDYLPDRKAWGSKASAFYGTGYADRDYDSLTAQEEELALLEEQEAKEIQKRLMKDMTEADFLFDTFVFDGTQQTSPTEKSKKAKSKGSKTASKDLIVIEKDLSDLTERQKKDLFLKDSPEFAGLVEDCTKQLSECAETMEPVLKFLRTHDKLGHPFAQLLQKRYELGLLYCSNITFYVLLKAQRVRIQAHPLVKRVLQMKQLLQELDRKYELSIKGQVEQLRNALAAGEEITFTDDADKRNTGAIKSQKRDRFGVLDRLESNLARTANEEESTHDELEDGDESELESASTSKRPKLGDSEELEDVNDAEEEEQEESADEAGKRKITYQIAKNKGLTVRKRRDQRNVRVKNKLKYRKALIRRKGAIRPVRTETTRYTGESSIKPFVKRGIKLK